MRGAGQGEGFRASDPQHKGITSIALQRSAVGAQKVQPAVQMQGRGKGKGLEARMLAAARAGFAGIPDWATEEEVMEVKRRHPDVFPEVRLKPFVRTDLQRLKFDQGSDGLSVEVSQVRLNGDAPTLPPVDATISGDCDAPGQLSGSESSGEEGDQAVQHGMSVAVAASSSDKKRKWVSERYSVRPGIINDILFRLHLPRPDIDVFADSRNHVFPRWFGEGGEVADAFDTFWGYGVGLLWINPPYSALDRTIDKVIRDGAEAVLVLPDWQSTSWWKDIQKYVLRHYFYPPGTKVFNLEGTEFDAGVRWGVWSYYVQVDGPHCGENRRAVQSVTYQKTRSARRRRQRKAAAQYWAEQY